MLFNSPVFLFAFLPTVLIAFLSLQRLGLRGYQSHLLLLASLFFYGWWSIVYLPLLLLSAAINYVFGQLLSHHKSKLLLAAAIGIDIALLGYFKYAAFGVRTVNSLLQASFPEGNIVLPLGISFYTFTQIAYLVDAYRGLVTDKNPVRYGLFVTFFPHLIAGPILHHEEMTQQFRTFANRRVTPVDISVGMTLFAMGLFKKIVLADTFAKIVNPAFDLAARGGEVQGAAAWMAVLGYTLQLYFDFSGYSDMAIGLARMIGVLMPQNFDSPYKSVSIVDFWTRWHMTLSRFLRDYLYIPLGGNRQGVSRSHLNVLITMLLGGLWHGAGWTFVIWGGMHGAYIVLNRTWSSWAQPRNIILPRALAVALTFFAVVIAWVPFRSADSHAAVVMYGAMTEMFFRGLGHASLKNLLLLLVGLGIVWLMPNSQELLARYNPVISKIRGFPPRLFEWRISTPFAVAFAILIVSTALFGNDVSQFLYFQF